MWHITIILALQTILNLKDIIADARYSDRGVGDPISPLLNIVINKT